MIRKRVLVTGASGFIGEALVAALIQSGHSVRAASRLHLALPEGPVEWVELPDLRNVVDWSTLLADMDVVVHLAGIAHRGDIDDEAIEKVNRVAVAALAAACQRQDVHLIFMSSAAVHAGSAANAVVTESQVPTPATAYDRAKLAAERAVAESSVSYTILRPVVVYGAGAKANFALAVRLARLSLPLPFGALHVRRSLVAIENLTAAVIFCLDGASTRNQIFLVADPEPIAVSAMFAQLRRGLGRSPRLVPVPAVLLEGALRIARRSDIWTRIGQEFVVDATKLYSAGFRPVVSSQEGLRAVGANYRTCGNTHTSSEQ